ncbi:MAG: phosphotransferase [Planctomycetota bacterium]
MNGGLWQGWSEEQRVFPLQNFRAAISYVRLKPLASCRLVVFSGEEGSADDPPPGFLLHLFPDAERARVAFEKETSRPHLIGSRGYEPIFDEERALVAVPFPNDPEIPDLRHVYQPEKFRRTLMEVLPDYPAATWRIQRQLIKTQLIAYKPGRRAVYRIKVKIRRRVGDEKVRVHLHAKLENPATCEASMRNLVTVEAAIPKDALWRVPPPRGIVEVRSFLARGWIEGDMLQTLALDQGSHAAELFRRTGVALAELHHLDLDLDHLLSPIEEGDALRQLAEDQAGLLPSQESRIRSLGDRLAHQLPRLSLCASAIVHGDFHAGQVLISAGKPPVLIDLDRAGRGYAAADLGSLLACLKELQLPDVLADAFLDGYKSRCAVAPQEQLVRILTAAALFRRAAFPFRTLHLEWPRLMERRLEQAEEALEGIQG